MRTQTHLSSGNIFAIRSGKNPGPPTYAGSHMDTQVYFSVFKSGSVINVL
jgi:hypothetical protein